MEHYKSEQKLWKILEEEPFFGNFADRQPAILSKKCTPLLISVNWFMYILGAPPSK